MRALPIAKSPPQPLSHQRSPCLFPLVQPGDELPSFSSVVFPSKTNALTAAILPGSFFEGFFEALPQGLTSALHTPLPTASAPSSATGLSDPIRLSSFPPLLFPRSFESGFTLSLRSFLSRSLRDPAVLIHPFPLLLSSPLSYYHTTHLAPQFYPHSDSRFTRKPLHVASR